MNDASVSSTPATQPLTTPLPPSLFEEHHEAPFLVWWHRLTLPPSFEMRASPQEREHVRQSHLTSHVLLITLLFVLLSFLLSFLSTNALLISIWTITFTVLLLAVVLNRLGRTRMSNIVVVAVLELGSMGSILTTLQTGFLMFPLFDVLVLPLVITVSLLPIRWSIGIAVLNGLFFTLTFVWASQTLECMITFHQILMSIVSGPFLLQGALFGIALLWRLKATNALARADRAEAIARLEHDLAEQGRIVAEQKQQLEEGLHQIIDTQLRVAYGDLHARVSLDDTHPLWQIAGSFNTLLTHYQHARQTEDEVQRTRIAVDYLLQTVRDAKQHLHGVAYKPTGTMIDVLAAELQRPVSTSNTEHPSEK